MPRPCSRCGRPVPEARKTCLYCGGAPSEGEAPAAGPVEAAEAREPEQLSTVTAAMALISLAQLAYRRQDLDATERLMSRLFLELHPDDLRGLLATMTEAWLKAMVQSAGPAGMAEASSHGAQGVAKAGAQEFLDAAAHFAEARAAYAHVARANPVAELLALGALSAGRLRQARAAREPQLKALVEQASRLAVTPGHKAEAVPLLQAALALLEPRRLLEDRGRAEKLSTLLQELSAGAEVAPDDPASVLPPAGALPPEAWNDLGLQLLAEHPAQARICFERAVAADPDAGASWLNLASARLATGASAAASIDAFRQAAARLPGEVRAWVGLAASLQEDRRYPEAAAAWDRAIALAPGAERPRTMRAFCGEAAALLAEGAAEGAEPWRVRGHAFLDAGRWALADLAYERALELGPRDLDTLCGKGLANVRWAQTLKAEDSAAARLRFRIGADAMEEARRLAPGNPDVARVLALCAKELGEG